MTIINSSGTPYSPIHNSTRLGPEQKRKAHKPHPAKEEFARMADRRQQALEDLRDELITLADTTTDPAKLRRAIAVLND